MIGGAWPFGAGSKARLGVSPIPQEAALAHLGEGDLLSLGNSAAFGAKLTSVEPLTESGL
jgi:hypothetical protein